MAVWAENLKPPPKIYCAEHHVQAARLHFRYFYRPVDQEL